MTSSGLVPPSSKKFLSLFEISCSSKYLSMAFKKLGKEKSGKKWRAWSTEGCNWRWVNRWKKKTLLFFLSLLNDFTKCTGGKEDESKKNPFHSFKKKMSLIVSIRSLCCMWYGWIKAGYFYILFFGLVWSGCYFWMARERKRGVFGGRGGMLFPVGLFPVPLVVVVVSKPHT